MDHKNMQLLGNGVKRTYGTEARRYNLLAARLISDLVKGFLGPSGLEKMFIDILGEMTVTKDGATFLRKIDVEHPAAKVIIEASNAVDNAVGDGTTSVVVLSGALVEKAEDLLEMGIPPHKISDGYYNATQMAIKIIRDVAIETPNHDKTIMKYLADTCLKSKAVNQFTQEMMIPNLVVDGICRIADFSKRYIEVDDIKIEEKIGSSSETELIHGVVVDKTIDESSMPKVIENARILLLDNDIQDERIKTDVEIKISNPREIKEFLSNKTSNLLQKIQYVIGSGANVVFSRGGIDPLALNHFSKNRILTVKRIKENDLQWLSKATGARVVRDLDGINKDDIGYAAKVYERMVHDDKMVFVDGCTNPKSVTLLLRATSKKILDEFHRTILDSIYVLRDFIMEPKIVPGVGVIAFLVVSLVVGTLTSRLVKKSSRRFMIAGKSLPLFFVGTMLAAQAVDGNSSLGNVSLVYQFGIWAGAAIPIGLGVCLMLTGAFYGKKLNKMSMLTLPDFYYRKVWTRSRRYLRSTYDD